LLSPTGEQEDDLNQSHSSTRSFENNHTGSTRVSVKYEKQKIQQLEEALEKQLNYS